ncbi:hypothetical protein FKM82_008992 [Ascaphus truei]
MNLEGFFLFCRLHFAFLHFSCLRKQWFFTLLHFKISPPLPSPIFVFKSDVNLMWTLHIFIFQLLQMCLEGAICTCWCNLGQSLVLAQ